jgi:hypothetical protein
LRLASDMEKYYRELLYKKWEKSILNITNTFQSGYYSLFFAVAELIAV